MKLRSRNHEGFTFYIFDSTKAWKTQFLFFETPSVGGALLLLPGLYEVTILVFPFGYSWIITTGLAVLKPFLSFLGGVFLLDGTESLFVDSHEGNLLPTSRLRFGLSSS